VGLPKDAISLSLLLFNLGVEAGQLIFVGAAIAAILALRPVRTRLPPGGGPAGPSSSALCHRRLRGLLGLRTDRRGLRLTPYDT
jgi:hypothetical protein